MPDPSYNYSYTPTVDHREENLYREEYYSSTDTKIYMDDEEQTEIGFIQYEIQEQLKPVYGYNSRTFDDVVIGNRIVTGTFTVPIKNKDKQEFSIEQLSTYTGEIKNESIENYNAAEEAKLLNTDWFGSTARNIDAKNNSNINTDILVKLIALGYDVNVNSSTQAYINAINKFQQKEIGSATGSLNEVTINKINEKFSQLNKEPINLNGATGFTDFTMKKGKTVLSGNGIILNTITTVNDTRYKVMDSNGNTFFIKGLLVNA
jgi:hypothetical protein